MSVLGTVCPSLCANPRNFGGFRTPWIEVTILRQGIRGRLWPTVAPVAVEYATHQYVAISSTRGFTDLEGTSQVPHSFSSHRGLHLLHRRLPLWLSQEWLLIDALVAETLANRPPQPQW